MKKKDIVITLGYYPQGTKITSKMLDEINRLLDENGYEGVYAQHILKYGLRNPYKRITISNAIKLINAIKNGNPIFFLDKG
jgi:hypothetical protein